jgi:hypothetical protein
VSGVSNSKENKARERRFVELFKEAYFNFPEGEIVADEGQERPDVVVVSSQGKIGIEITSLYDSKLKRTESECEKAVLEARRIYEKQNLPKLHVSVHIGGESSFNRTNRKGFAATIANLVAANVPPPGKYAAVENDFNDPKRFPYEIDSIYIYQYSWPDENNWTAPSAGFYREHFVEELQRVISEKDSKLKGYMPGCKEQWLLVVAENSSPSTFFDPSEETVNHRYKSAFHKVFVMELFKVKVFELKLVGNA